MKILRVFPWIFLLVILLAAVGIAVFFSFEARKPLIDPLSTSETEQKRTDITSTGKEVYGFLPYWNIRTANIHSALTTVSYFSLTLDTNGNIQTRDEGTLEQGWRMYQSDSWENVQESLRAQGQRAELVITMMNADAISAFLLNENSRKNAVDNLVMLVKSQPISGINIDIEYAGTVTDQLRNAYASFIREVRHSTKAADKNTRLSIDVFADSAEQERIWDFSQLGEFVDYVVVMAYDFHRSSSPVSGPVAPIFGSEKNRWTTDVMKSMRAFFKTLPQEKILLGIPFYGYEWRTVSGTPGAQTFPQTGGIATYKRIQQLISDEGIREQWDFDALSPYITYDDGGVTKTAYYENSQSLTYKLELVNQAKLGGIAIWALGYEGNTAELWDVIAKQLGRENTY